jgi:hypothetical protein
MYSVTRVIAIVTQELSTVKARLPVPSLSVHIVP